MNIGAVIASTLTIAFVSLYPSYLKRYKIQGYRGWWKTFGDLYQTPQRALVYPVTWLIGNLVYMYLFSN